MKKTILRLTGVFALLSGFIPAACNRDNGPPSKPLPTPTNLAATEVTENSAMLSWDAVQGAAIYELKVAGIKTFTVGGAPALRIVDLDYLTGYSWSVRAKTGTRTSEWADEQSFTTGNIDRIEFQEIFLRGYHGNYFGKGTSNFGFYLHDFIYNPEENPDAGGFELGLDLISTAVDDGADVAVLDIPEGTYTIDNSRKKGTICTGNGDTWLFSVVDSDIGERYTVTGGSVTIEGDHSYYQMRFDVATSEAGTLHFSYNGPFVIENDQAAPPDEDIDLGTLRGISQFDSFEDAMEDGSCDAWIITAYSEGLELNPETNIFEGSGWIARLMTHAEIGTGKMMPNGTYTIDRSHAPMTALAGDKSAGNGMQLVKLEENKVTQIVYLTSGTVTSHFRAAITEYTITVDATQENQEMKAAFSIVGWKVTTGREGEN